MRRRLSLRALAAALVLVLAATGIAVAAGASSTVNQTIADRDGDDRLEPGARRRLRAAQRPRHPHGAAPGHGRCSPSAS